MTRAWISSVGNFHLTICSSVREMLKTVLKLIFFHFLGELKINMFLFTFDNFYLFISGFKEHGAYRGTLRFISLHDLRI